MLLTIIGDFLPTESWLMVLWTLLGKWDWQTVHLSLHLAQFMIFTVKVIIILCHLKGPGTGNLGHAAILHTDGNCKVDGCVSGLGDKPKVSDPPLGLCRPFHVSLKGSSSLLGSYPQLCRFLHLALPSKGCVFICLHDLVVGSNPSLSPGIHHSTWQIVAAQ